MEYLQALRDFCGYLITHVVVIAALFGINLLSSSHDIWAVELIQGWGIGLAVRPLICSGCHACVGHRGRATKLKRGSTASGDEKGASWPLL